MAFHYHKTDWDPNFHKLYNKASAEQWSVGDLNWAQIQENMDPEWKQGLLSIMSPLLVSERGAMQACGTMLPRLRDAGDMDSELVMHAMMLDEARHWEGLNRLFNECQADPTDIAEFKEMLGINLVIMRSAEFDQWLWCINICDIIAGHLYGAFKSNSGCPPVTELFTGFLKDEARHHRFCQLFFQREADKFTLEQKRKFKQRGGKLVKKFGHMITGRLHDDFTRIGVSSQDIFEKIAASVERQANAYGFSD